MKIPHPMLKLQIEMTDTSQKEEVTGNRPGKLLRTDTGPKKERVRDDPLLNSGIFLHYKNVPESSPHLLITKGASGFALVDPATIIRQYSY